MHLVCTSYPSLVRCHRSARHQQVKGVFSGTVTYSGYGDVHADACKELSLEASNDSRFPFNLFTSKDHGVVGGAPTIISLDGLLWQHPGTAKIWRGLRFAADIRSAATTFLAGEGAAPVASASAMLAVHWRTTDFRRLRAGALVSAEELIHIIKDALRTHRHLTHVYLSTDNDDSEELASVQTALGSTLLPSFRTSDAAFGMDAQLIAAVEQHICTTAKVFFGTQTSNFSLVIRTLRDHSGVDTSMDTYMME